MLCKVLTSEACRSLAVEGAGEGGGSGAKTSKLSEDIHRSTKSSLAPLPAEKLPHKPYELEKRCRRKSRNEAEQELIGQ